MCRSPVKESVYRIAQEALHNAVKHAQADRLDIRLTRESDVLSLEVRETAWGLIRWPLIRATWGCSQCREP